LSLWNFCSPLAYLVVRICTIGGMAIIAVSASLDHIQIGSNLAFIGVFTGLVSTLVATVRAAKTKQGLNASPGGGLLQALAVLSFATAGIHDTILFYGVIPSYPIFPIGVIAMIAFLALAVNERITEAYQERDRLKAEQGRFAAQQELAAQVVHDLKSPL